jgi:dolichyl-phosphate-mannose--protein O-mannosyl transferase
MCFHWRQNKKNWLKFQNENKRDQTGFAFVEKTTDFVIEFIEIYGKKALRNLPLNYDEQHQSDFQKAW